MENDKMKTPRASQSREKEKDLRLGLHHLT
jgi:hypothetical protein